MVDNASPIADLPPHTRGSRLSDFTKKAPLLPAEEKLREACMRGETCVIDDGTRPNASTNENTIRASFLRYLILGGCEESPLHQRGVHLYGAFIACRNSHDLGKYLDLEAATIPRDIKLVNCWIDGSVSLNGAKTRNVCFDGTTLDELFADGIQCEGNIFLRHNFRANSCVRLLGATLSGSLECTGGSFEDKVVSLACDRIRVKGGIFLNSKFRALGAVRLVGAKTGGILNCIDGKFESSQLSLICDDIEIDGGLFLSDGFQANGVIRLPSAKVGENIACRGGHCKSHFYANNATIGGNLFLDKHFQSHGTIHLPNAHIGGNILCDGGTFHNKDKAILANKATIDGNVILGVANAAGTFSFQSAIIGGDFSANGATLSAKPSLELRGAEIKGTFHWRDIKHAPGRLDLGGASAKTVNMDEASWQKPKSIKLNNFTYKSFDNLESGANSNYWKRFLEQQPNDDLGEKFRPRPYEQLAKVLHSMGYEEEARSIRIKRQQLHTNFMAKYDPDRFATRSDGRQHWRVIHWLTVFARRTLIGPLVDYGFRPGKAVLYLLMLILIGSGVYWKAARFGVMTPTHPLIFKEAIDRGDGKLPIINPQCAENWVYFPKEVEAECRASVPSEYSEFQSLIYAADVALPIVNLRMENDWAPRVVDTSGNRDWLGWWVRTFEWFLIIMGWVLSLLFASAVGGIIRR